MRSNHWRENCSSRFNSLNSCGSAANGKPERQAADRPERFLFRVAGAAEDQVRHAFGCGRICGEDRSGARARGDGLASLRPLAVRLPADGDIGAALRVSAGISWLGGRGHRSGDAGPACPRRFARSLRSGRLTGPAPSSIGYVRAYARALGLDAEAVVARFRHDAPDVDDRLRAPSGLSGHGRRFGVLALIVALLIAAVVGWNIMRRAAVAPRHVTRAAMHLAPRRADPGPTVLGAPLPAPPEAAAPPTYETPASRPRQPSRPTPIRPARLSFQPAPSTARRPPARM